MKNKTKEVIRFEVVRSLKKPSFWIAAVLIPVGFALYIAIAAAVGYNTESAIANGTDTSNMKLGVYDAASYITEKKIINSEKQEQSLAEYKDKESGISDVREKKLDVFYYIPADFEKNQQVEIYIKPEGISLVDDYSMPIRTLLMMAATTHVQPLDLAVITNTISYNTTTFDVKDDHVVDEGEKIRQILGPGIALVCFYILMIVLGNRLTTAMVEEKENRISELILTSVKPINLIIGKIVSLMIVGIIQLIVLVAPMLLLYKIAQNGNIFPDNFAISFDFANIAMYMALLVISYFLFTAMSMIIGVISPTAKDANSYTSVMVLMVIMPILFMNVFLPSGIGPLTYVLSYFPPSAPIALMIRGACGNLPTWEFWLGFADIAISGILLAKLASYIFCRNAIEFTPKINFAKLFKSPRKQWKK